MKKIFILLFVLLFIKAGLSQNYQISFTGSGASTVVDSVKVENLTQCKSIIISGSNILNLVGTLGVNELNTGTDKILNIYPNPMLNNCLIGFNATNQGNATIKLYDISGKIILHEQEMLSKGHHSYNLSGINSGVYFIKVESSDYSYNAKIISNNGAYGTAKIKHIVTTPINEKQSTSLNIEKIENGKSVIEMQYTTGNRLKLTGFSGGIYRTIVILVPTSNKTITFNFVACTDADGNNYSVVQIGSQIWMAENLKTTHYSDNTPIPNITDTAEWASATTAAYCDFDNNPENSEIYGKYYNWFTGRYSTVNKNLAPAGWHVPTDVEWLGMYHYIGSNAARKLQEACSILWQNPNSATNETGFTALPSGNRTTGGQFIELGNICYFWTNYPCSSSTGLAWFFDYLGGMNGQCRYYNSGFSVRCIKD